MKIRAAIQVLAVIGSITFGGNFSNAAVIAYEGFNYAAGNLNTQNGGTGWSDAWGASGGSAGTFSVASSGLSYTGLTTSGNDVASAAGTSKIFRTLSSSVGPATGSNIYVSFLLNQPSANFGDLTFFNGTNELFSIGDTYTGAAASSTYSLYKSALVGGYVNSGVSIVPSTTQLLVLEIDYSTPADGANLYMYLNPTIGTTAPSHASAIVSTSGSIATANFTFDRIRLEANGGTLDEIRIADSFADVVAVPEPSTLVLVLMGSLGLVLYQRRRRPAV